MHLIIGGCGRVGADLAEQLSSDGHDVVVLDHSPEAFDRLGAGFNGETLVGDTTDKEPLLRAGIDNADGLVAVTASDNANLMTVEIARELFGVHQTVARLFNPAREDSYRKMGVHYVSGTRLVAKAILNELPTGTFPLHVSFSDSDVEIVQVLIAREGHGATVAELEGMATVRVAAISRGRRVRVARNDDRLREGDVVVAALAKGAHRRLRGVAAHPQMAER
jgi:trk system potassium uptake protein TrkA